MKKNVRIAFAVLTLLSLVFMFLPIAHFDDNSAASLTADIEKQQERVERAQANLDRHKEAGRDADALAKDQEKIDKEQQKLDELIAEQEAASEGGEDGLSYSLLPGKLPEELELDQALINQYKTYQANFDGYYTGIKVAAALLVVSLLLFLAGGDRPASKYYTLSSIANLIAGLLVVYTVLRLRAFPIALPYGNAEFNLIVLLPTLVLPFLALFTNISNVQNTKRTMIYILCTLLSILSLLPFWIMMVNATRNSNQIQQSVSLIPSSYLMYNWRVLEMKEFNIMLGFKNSAIIAFGSTLMSVYFSALTAYGLTVYKFKGSKLLYSIILGIIMIPGQVTGTGFYMFMYRLNWVNSYLPLIIPSIAAASTVFFFKQYLEANFQISLVEAARIDGAGEFFTYNTIIMPIMVPAMATMGIMAVIGSWNNYLTPLMLLTDPTMKTLPMMVKELRGDIYRTEYGSIYLGLTMTALPLIIIYFCFSKYIIAGVAVGGVKE